MIFEYFMQMFTMYGMFQKFLLSFIKTKCITLLKKIIFCHTFQRRSFWLILSSGFLICLQNNSFILIIILAKVLAWWCFYENSCYSQQFLWCHHMSHKIKQVFWKRRDNIFIIDKVMNDVLPNADFLYLISRN